MVRRNSSRLVVITIPAYNEEKTLPSLLERIHKTMKATHRPYHLQVVDDGSSDRTVNVARIGGAKVISHPKNYGLAKTFSTEIDAAIACGAWAIVHIDADGQYLPEEIPLLLKELDNGAELVLGSRFMGKIESMPLINRVGNRAFSSVISSLVRTKITDAQTGFRAFTSTVAKSIPITSSYTYTHEQLIRAERMKFTIREVPVNARKTRKSRLMKNPFDYAIKAWITILRLYRDYEPFKFFGMIGSLFLTAGLIVGGYLLWLFVNTGNIGGRVPLAIFSMMMMVIGLQVILFGFLADMLKR